MSGGRVSTLAIAMALVMLAGAVVAIWHAVQETAASEIRSASDCTAGIAVEDPVNNPGLVSDCEALLQSRDTLSGSGTLNWSNTAPMHRWSGISLGGTPLRVTEVRLPFEGLGGVIPPELGKLSRLEQLDLSGNRLPGTIPSELGELSALAMLDLSENRLRGKIPSKLGRLTNLEGLYLYDNRFLDGSIPPEIGNLTNLKRLELDGNRLTGRIPPELGRLESLVWLKLGSNHLSGDVPVQLSNLSNLQSMDIGRSRLSGKIPSELGHLEQLRELELDGNRLVGEIPASLVNLPNLTRLLLNGNSLTGCVPMRIMDAPDNDLSELGLPVCSQPASGLGVGNTTWSNRVNTPILVTAWFSEQVSGLTADDVSVANGGAGNLSGSGDGMVYNFEVTPRHIGEVTVDLSANSVVGANAIGNTVAGQLSLGIPYDDDRNGAISREEVIAGISDHLFGGLLTRDQIVALIGLHLFGPTASVPDLVVGTATVSDSSPTAGATFALSTIVRNDGTLSSDTVTLRYYRSADSAITASDTPVGAEPVEEIGPSLSIAEAIVLTVPATPGTYYYGACVDAVYGESDTTNNCSAGVAITVVEPAAPAPRPAVGPIPGAKTGGTIKYIPQGSIRIIDPMATGAIVTGTVGRHVYDQLFWRDSNYHIYPQMLESWGMSSDGKQYTFRVRPDQKFHNGDPLRMVDIAESHNRFARVDRLGWELLGISAGNEGKARSAQVFNHILDETNNTIVMKFEEPTAVVLEFLAAVDPRQPSVMHEGVWSIDAGQPVNEAIGTGAFMMTEWRQQDLLEFERHPDYVLNTGEPWDFTKGEITQYLDGFVALEIPSHTTRIALLATGEVDVLDDFRLDLAVTIDGHPDIEWGAIRDGNYGVHTFNFRHPPFDMTEAGRLARRAVYAASPNDKIMQAAVGDSRFWKECYMEIHCGTPWTTVVADEVQAEGIKTYSGNLGLARQILDEAEALDPMIRDYPLRLVAASDMPFMPEAGLVMSQTLKDMGFTNVELVSVDWASRVALTGNPDGPWEMATSWSNFSNGLHPLAPSMASSSAEGSGRWVEPRMTDLREQFLSEVDPAQQQELFDDMNRLLYENPARVWHFMFSPVRAIRSDVKNFCLDCLFPIFHNVWLDR